MYLIRWRFFEVAVFNKLKVKYKTKNITHEIECIAMYRRKLKNIAESSSVDVQEWYMSLIYRTSSFILRVALSLIKEFNQAVSKLIIDKVNYK